MFQLYHDAGAVAEPLLLSSLVLLSCFFAIAIVAGNQKVLTLLFIFEHIFMGWKCLQSFAAVGWAEEGHPACKN